MIRLAVQRPIAVAMIYMALALLGVAAWRGLPLELLPDTELPRLTVAATWAGASPEAAEAFLTAPLEAAIQQVRGVERIQSVSTEGRASISVEFQRETDMDFARLELSERLASLDESLPLAASPPTITPYIPPEFREQTRPFLEYTVAGPYTTEALRAHVDSLIVPELLRMEGVADVLVYGGRERLLEIDLDPARVEAFGQSLAGIRSRLQSLGYVGNAGVVDVGGVRHVLAIRYGARSVDELRALPVLTDAGRTVRLSDLATVRDAYQEPVEHYRIDGQPAISFQVVRGYRTNAIQVAERVKTRLAGIEAVYPPGVRLILDNDESEAIRTQLTELRTRALGSAAIIFVVLLLFLRSFRSAGIVFATIGFSALITLNGVYWSGLSLNVLTLMGLAMGFGLVVDNAIVVLENVYRHWRRGASAEDAAERGTREVVMPVIAATLTTVIVLVPFVYLQGELRIFYVPLGFVVGISLLASVFVAFSFIPALAARSLGRSAEGVGAPSSGAGPLASRYPHEAASGSARLPVHARFYRAASTLTLRFPWTTVALAALSLAGSGYLFDRHVTRGVVWNPYREVDSFVSVTLALPRGEELARTDEMARFFEERIVAMEGIGRFVTRVQPENANIRVTFPDSVEMTALPLLIQERLAGYAYLLGGARVTVVGVGPAFSAGGMGGIAPNYRIRVFGYNYEAVRDIAEDIGRRLASLSRIAEVDTNASGQGFTRDRATELVVEPDRERLALHGLTARDLVAQVTAAIAGADGRASVLRLGGEQVGYALKLSGHETMDVLALDHVSMRGSSGESVRLGEIASVREREVLGRIVRENQQYERTVAYEFRGPVRLGDVVRDAVIETTHLPAGYSIVGRSEFTLSLEDERQIYAVLALALVLVFMLTAGLFESVRQPLVIILTVPMALVGVFLTFYLAGASFTREAYIGVVMMAGIVVNNAILLIDHINRLRSEGGRALNDAILQGVVDRSRPILMTAATTVLGLLPLVLFGADPDGRIWNALAYALIGGLTSSTLLVLTVTPALYLLFERRVEKVDR